MGGSNLQEVVVQRDWTVCIIIITIIIIINIKCYYYYYYHSLNMIFSLCCTIEECFLAMSHNPVAIEGAIDSQVIQSLK